MTEPPTRQRCGCALSSTTPDPNARLCERCHQNRASGPDSTTLPTVASGKLPTLAAPDRSPLGEDIDDCRILALLGSGAMGDVYLGYEEFADRKVAVKVLKRELLQISEQARARFRNEVRAIGRVRSNHVVQLYGSGRLAGGGLYMKMEYVRGNTLEQWTDPGPRPRVQQVGTWMLQAARGLYDAERAGIVHRDIKPANLLLREDGTVLVADFGIAALDDARTRLTGEHAMLGTPLYMSPEQFAGRPADVRSDVYALGATMFHLLTGKRPIDGTTMRQLMRAKATVGELSLRQIDADQRDSRARQASWSAMDRLLRSMTARDPDRRPQSFEVVITMLEAALRASDQPRGVPWRSLAVTLALAGAALVLPLLSTGDAPEQTPTANTRSENARTDSLEDAPVSIGGPAKTTSPPVPAESRPAKTVERTDTSHEPAKRARAQPASTTDAGAGNVSDANADEAVTPSVPDPAPEGTPPPTQRVHVPPTPDHIEALQQWASWSPGAHTESDHLGHAFPIAVTDVRRSASMRLVSWSPAGSWFYADVEEVSWQQWKNARLAVAEPHIDDAPTMPVRSMSSTQVETFLARHDGLDVARFDEWKLLAYGRDQRPFPWPRSGPRGAFRFARWERRRINGTAALHPCGADIERSTEGFRSLVTNVKELVRRENDFGVVGVGYDEQLFPHRYQRQTLRCKAHTSPAHNLGFRCVRRIR